MTGANDHATRGVVDALLQEQSHRLDEALRVLEQRFSARAQAIEAQIAHAKSTLERTIQGEREQARQALRKVEQALTARLQAAEARNIELESELELARSLAPLAAALRQLVASSHLGSER